MSIFNDIAGLLRGSVGNNMDNDPDDVINTKRNFAAIGRYKKPVENGYIDKELDAAILSHQRENKLKVDGIMKPGGETEASIIGHRLGLPKIEPNQDEKETGIQQVNLAVLPLIARLGLPLVAGSLWWQNEANKEQREGIVRALESKSDDKIDDEEFKRRCDEIFNKNMQKCIELGQEHGSDRFRACKESAWTQYAQCLSGKPKENWRGLQVK